MVSEGELIPGLSGCPFKLARVLEHKWRRLLRDLMVAVDRKDINQENICVINTALIFLVTDPLLYINYVYNTIYKLCITDRKDINQENICVISTALIFLVIKYVIYLFI